MAEMIAPFLSSKPMKDDDMTAQDLEIIHQRIMSQVRCAIECAVHEISHFRKAMLQLLESTYIADLSHFQSGGNNYDDNVCNIEDKWIVFTKAKQYYMIMHNISNVSGGLETPFLCHGYLTFVIEPILSYTWKDENQRFQTVQMFVQN